VVISPHVAWYCSASFDNVRASIKENVEAFVAGKPVNVVI